MRPVPWRPALLLLLVLSPTAVLAALLADPERNPPLFIPVEHFVITTNVSIVALLVAIFVARAALGAGHYPSLLVAVGFPVHGRAARGQSGEPVVQFGVGMHTGDVVLRAIGLPERSDYTAIGDTVNTASRMETLTKEYTVDAVLSGRDRRSPGRRRRSAALTRRGAGSRQV